MTPAVSMDDIEDPKAREILVKDMYTSDMTRGMREGIRPYFKVVAPLPERHTESNPVSFDNLLKFFYVVILLEHRWSSNQITTYRLK